MAGDAFLDVVGSGFAPVRSPAPRHAAPRRIWAGQSLVAAVPVAAALLALALVAASGLSRRSGLPEALEPYAYGYFLDRYPLFAFALVYGAARIVAAAAGPGMAGPVRRVVFALLGLVALGAAGLYPTFGGLTLRGGYATGSMAFLTGQPLWLAYALGAAVAASMVGGIVGVAVIAASRPLRPSWRRIGWGALSFVSLGFGAGVVGLAKTFGFGPWPARAMTASEAGLAAGLLLVAMAPHSLLVGLRRRRAVA
ncbi:hypothetical protein [Methylobacterium sp. J-067]|uniref:hypothetical protein n=1 Tax=Methylobacterium sp. J-067 TaxID=2836648 RepID=UPI001FBBC2F2|nr:hypothetical protein [Methylobacterium sp. J-067]MCJ2024876.1 hypothetical protein [Methylobacterium sp. J-067]